LDKPEDDPYLTGAIKKHRVLTVVQESGKKDHGFVGFKVLHGALYLEFPRPLTHEEDARVVGIDYKLIDEPIVPEKDRVKPGKPAKPQSTHKKPAEPSPPPEPVVQKPKPHEFIVRVRRTATIEDEIKVKALDQSAAEQQHLSGPKQIVQTGKAVQAEIVKTDERSPSRSNAGNACNCRGHLQTRLANPWQCTLLPNVKLPRTASRNHRGGTGWLQVTIQYTSPQVQGRVVDANHSSHQERVCSTQCSERQTKTGTAS
jgi:hypothetical protein